VIPYVQNVSDSVARIMRKYDVPVAMKPYQTLKNVLVHPKDKQNKEDDNRMRVKVPCANCDKTYVGGTGRKYGVSLQEHRTEVEAKTTWMFTRSQHVSSLSEHNKSALTDCVAEENHMINWSKAMVIDREPVRFSRWIKEAVHICKEGQSGRGQLSTQSRLRPLS